MTVHKPNVDITVRGGMINYPAAQIPIPPPRHQPDTPRTKKQTKVRPDHQFPPAKKESKQEPPKEEPITEPTNEIPEELD